MKQILNVIKVIINFVVVISLMLVGIFGIFGELELGTDNYFLKLITGTSIGVISFYIMYHFMKGIGWWEEEENESANITE